MVHMVTRAADRASLQAKKTAHASEDDTLKGGTFMVVMCKPCESEKVGLAAARNSNEHQ